MYTWLIIGLWLSLIRFKNEINNWSEHQTKIRLKLSEWMCQWMVMVTFSALQEGSTLFSLCSWVSLAPRSSTCRAYCLLIESNKTVFLSVHCAVWLTSVWTPACVNCYLSAVLQLQFSKFTASEDKQLSNLSAGI